MGNSAIYMNRGRIVKSQHRQRREQYLIQQALEKMGLRYWMKVTLSSPLHTDRNGTAVGGEQWADFIVRTKKRTLFAIEFYPKWGRHNPHKYQINWMMEKKALLEGRGVPVLILDRGLTGQEYWGYIHIFLHTGKHPRTRRTR